MFSCGLLLSFTQDFEALTPNLLARTVETVEGGGIVVLLLRTMNSLKQLYTMTMVSINCYFLHIRHPAFVDTGSMCLFSFRMCMQGTALRLIRMWWEDSTRGA